MTARCWVTHHWVEVRRSFVPRCEHLSGGCLDRETARQLMFGLTTIELMCQDCGELRFKYCDGNIGERP